MKVWPAVEVIWHDAHGGDEGWVSLRSIEAKPAAIRSVGMLAKDTKHGVTLVMSFDKSSRSTAAYIFIPRENIETIKGLE